MMVIVKLHPLVVLLLVLGRRATIVSSLIARIVLSILLFSADSLMFREVAICVCFYSLRRDSSFIRMSGLHSIILCIIIAKTMGVGVHLVDHGKV